MTDLPLAMTLLWIWMGIVAVIVLGYLAFRWYRKRYPRRSPEPELRYAQRLQHRLNKHRIQADVSKKMKSHPSKKAAP